jgi:hypothetical protein
MPLVFSMQRFAILSTLSVNSASRAARQQLSANPLIRLS